MLWQVPQQRLMSWLGLLPDSGNAFCGAATVCAHYSCVSLPAAARQRCLGVWAGVVSGMSRCASRPSSAHELLVRHPGV